MARDDSRQEMIRDHKISQETGDDRDDKKLIKIVCVCMCTCVCVCLKSSTLNRAITTVAGLELWSQLLEHQKADRFHCASDDANAANNEDLTKLYREYP